MQFHMRSPAILLTLCLVAIAGAVALTMMLALIQPSVEARIRTIANDFPILLMPQDERRTIVGLAAGGALAERQFDTAEDFGNKGTSAFRALVFERTDFVEDPDMLETYEAINSFFDRQNSIAAILTAETVDVAVSANPDGTGPVELIKVTTTPVRSIFSLPAQFWIQLGSGLVVIVIAAFFVSLRSRSFAVWSLALAGLGITGSAFTAAIYSSRAIGMNGTTLEALSFINHIFTFSFGVGIIFLFAIYPARVLSPTRLIFVPVICVLVLLSYHLQIVPIDLVRAQNLMGLLLIGIVIMVIWQYRATRGNPADRAALLWLGLSVLFGSAAFVLLVSTPILFGYDGLITQAFGFVLLAMIYVGTALSLLRYRLFDIGRWSYRVLFYSAVIVGLILVDLLFVLTLQMSARTSLALSSIVAVVVYFPVRDFIVERYLQRRAQDLPELYRRTVAVAYRFDAPSKQEAWREVLERAFEPGHMERSEANAVHTVSLHNEGLEMHLPAYPWSDPLVLGLARRGGRLFDGQDIRLVEELADIVSAAETDRMSYERGAREERQRIARDLHDDVGATLLSGLHARDENQRQESLVEALSDIRQIAHDLAGRDVTVERLVAQLRHESRGRAELHGSRIEWALGSADDSEIALPYHFHRNLSAIHREALSNALKHGEKGLIRIATEIEDNKLVLTICNETEIEERKAATGRGARAGKAAIAAPRLEDGMGLHSIETRAAELGGTASISEQPGRFTLTTILPLPDQPA